MLDTIRFIIAAVLTAGGLFCMLSAVMGVYKFRYALSRIHAQKNEDFFRTRCDAVFHNDYPTARAAEEAAAEFLHQFVKED